MHFNLITILGPTATGKTKLAVYLANHFNGEIISADSRQVYKFMDIGTGKDLSDYTIEKKKIKYHLIDIAEPKEEYNLYRFLNDFNSACRKIHSKKKLPFLVGGSGLYISAVIQNYNLPKANSNKKRIEELKELSVNELRLKLKDLKPSLHNTTDLINKERIITAILIEESAKDSKINITDEINSLNIGILPERDEIKRRIKVRLQERLNSGMIKEVENLLQMGVTHDKLRFFGLEYKFISQYLRNELNYNDMFQKLNSAINNFAKRQITWFRKMEKEGVKIHWFDGSDYEIIKNLIEESLRVDE